MALPPDPAAFVAAAEAGIDARDLDATAGVYAAEARLESLTDGAWEAYDGAAAIRLAWTAYLEVMQRRSFTLAKVLLSARDDLIVNDWTGTFGGGAARGIEHWRFDGDGKVIHHRMYSFLLVKPSSGLHQRARLALSYPLGSLAFLTAQRRAGVKPGR